MKNTLFFLMGFGLLMVQMNPAFSQSNPKMDRPVQQCIMQNTDKLVRIKKDFSIGHWLGKLISNCEKLQASSGKAGGPLVIALLEMEKDLDELIAMADNCEVLKDEKVKKNLSDMKAVYQEKQKVETFKTGDEEEKTGNLFEEDKEISTLTLTRGGAGKIKGYAERIKKILMK